MDWIPILIALVAGFIIGIIVPFVLRIIQTKSAKELAAELFKKNENYQKESIDSLVNNIKSIFGDLSLDALKKSTDEFLKLAKTKLESEREIGKQELDEKKGLIDQQLKNMTAVLETTTNVIKDLEKDREKKFGELETQLKNTNENTAVLTQTTQSL